MTALPAYKTIANDLRKRLGSRLDPIGSQLPTIAELCDRYDVAGVQTVRDAYALLIEEGLVVARQGAGFFVASFPEPARLSPREALDALETSIDEGLAALRSALIYPELAELQSVAIPAVGSRWHWEPAKPAIAAVLKVQEVIWNGEEYWVTALNLSEGRVNHVPLGRWIEATVAA